MSWGDRAVTLILAAPDSDIHRCPACGANCAIDHGMLDAAANAGQKVRIACHKCDEIFRPVADSSAGSARPSRPNPNHRVGICAACGDRFSVPPLAADDSVLVECPHCRHQMAPDEIGHANARRELFDSMNAAAGKWVTGKGSGRGWLQTAIWVIVSGAILAGVGLAVIERVTPNSTPLAGLMAAPAARLAVTDAGFSYSGDDENALLVTVTLANLGTAEGAPERVTVNLLDAEGNILMTRPIASRELTLSAGSSRTLVSRVAMSPGLVTDVAVDLKRAGDQP